MIIMIVISPFWCSEWNKITNFLFELWRTTLATLFI